jgi:hypothetical protein
MPSSTRCHGKSLSACRRKPCGKWLPFYPVGVASGSPIGCSPNASWAFAPVRPSRSQNLPATATVGHWSEECAGILAQVGGLKEPAATASAITAFNQCPLVEPLYLYPMAVLYRNHCCQQVSYLIQIL